MSNEVAGFNPVSLMPATFDDKYQMAGILCRSGLIPQGLNTPEKVCVALEWGHELQLSPMVAVNNIAVINGKPTLSADLMGALVKRSPEYGGIEWTCQTEEKAECVITRILPNGKEEKYTSTFTIEDAKNAGLIGKDVWRKYPKRMLKHRCMAYGLRDVFPDLLAGLYSPEEMESVEAEPQIPQERNVTPPKQPEQKAEQKPNVIAPNPEPQEDKTEAAINLEQLLNEHGIELRYKNCPKGQKQPYTLAKDALDNPNSTKAELEAMYSRCVAFLTKKGIQVA